jgi:hypothetical protein
MAIRQETLKADWVKHASELPNSAKKMWLTPIWFVCSPSLKLDPVHDKHPTAARTPSMAPEYAMHARDATCCCIFFHQTLESVFKCSQVLLKGKLMREDDTQTTADPAGSKRLYAVKIKLPSSNKHFAVEGVAIFSSSIHQGSKECHRHCSRPGHSTSCHSYFKH